MDARFCPGLAPASGGDPLRERPSMRERRALAGHGGHGGGERRRSRLRPSPFPSTVSSVVSERTPLAHAGALTERVAARGRRQEGALLAKHGKAKYHLFTQTPNLTGGERAEAELLRQWGGVERGVVEGVGWGGEGCG